MDRRGTSIELKAGLVKSIDRVYSISRLACIWMDVSSDLSAIFFLFYSFFLFFFSLFFNPPADG